jgi:hypothetical protein
MPIYLMVGYVVGARIFGLSLGIDVFIFWEENQYVFIF